jgi:hypothetical protein
MRRFGAAILVGSAFMVGTTPALGQAPPPLERHFHSLGTPNGKTHVIAGGLTQNAPCGAFRNFHGNVHLAVFVSGNNPLDVTPTFTGVFCP